MSEELNCSPGERQEDYGVKPTSTPGTQDNPIGYGMMAPPPVPVPPPGLPAGVGVGTTRKKSMRKLALLICGCLVLLTVILVPVLLIVLGDGGGAYKKKAEPVLSQLQKLDSYTDVGINFIDYSKEVRDLKASFDSFSAECSATDKLKLSYIAMEKAVNALISAKANWQSSIDADWSWLEDSYKDLMQADWATASSQTLEAARWLNAGK